MQKSRKSAPVQFYLCFVTAFVFLKRCAVSQTAWWVLKQLPKIILVSVQTCCIHVTLKKNQVKHANIISDGATKDNKCSRECRRWWLWKLPHRHFLNCSQTHAVWNWRGVLLSYSTALLTAGVQGIAHSHVRCLARRTAPSPHIWHQPRGSPFFF